MSRAIRQPPSQADFDTRVISSTGRSLAPAIRLCDISHPSQFFASRGSRLTPGSLRFRCVYLAATEETAVAEVWGDRFYAHREKGNSLYVIPATDAAKWAFLKVAAVPAANLCDLTDGDVLQQVGIDQATLYHTDFKIPQGWAECIANHPAKFDGIRYFSRLTHEVCIVLWLRPGGPAFERELKFGAPAPFLDSTAAHAVAARQQLRLSFPR